MQVSRRLSGLAAILTGCGLIAAGAVPAVAASRPAVHIAITAKSRLAKVTGDTLVAYKGGKYALATISGTVTGASGTAQAELLARPFGQRKFQQVAAQPLTSGRYSFTQRPTAATTYQVQVTSGSTTARAKHPVAVYVEGIIRQTGGHRCRNFHPVCTQTLRLYVVVPPAAYRNESGKYWFRYAGLRLGRAGHTPPLPRYLRRDHRATASRPRKLHADEFLVVLRFRFGIGARSYRLAMGYCTRDTEKADGLGLPGHHGCGDKRVRLHSGYLG